MFQASKEFGDPHLRIHILTVLKGMQSRKKVSSSSNLDTTEKKSETSFIDENTCIPVELFGILAVCEKQKNPGEALLLKAKDMCWSILAMVASCFADVSPLSCLTVWLEITAARLPSAFPDNTIFLSFLNNFYTFPTLAILHWKSFCVEFFAFLFPNCCILFSGKHHPLR